MEILFLLIPIALLLVALAFWAFYWSVNDGQFDDLESPAHSILYDDDQAMIPEEAKTPSMQSAVNHSTATQQTNENAKP